MLLIVLNGKMFLENFSGLIVDFPSFPLRAVRVLFSPMVYGWAGGRAAGKVCPACISGTVRCRKFGLTYL